MDNLPQWYLLLHFSLANEITKNVEGHDPEQPLKNQSNTIISLFVLAIKKLIFFLFLPLPFLPCNELIQLSILKPMLMSNIKHVFTVF